MFLLSLRKKFEITHYSIQFKVLVHWEIRQIPIELKIIIALIDHTIVTNDEINVPAKLSHPPYTCHIIKFKTNLINFTCLKQIYAKLISIVPDIKATCERDIVLGSSNKRESVVVCEFIPEIN